MLFRRQQPVGQISVIGKKQQAFCVNIKTAHRKQIPSDFSAKQIDYCFMNPILCRRNNTLWLIQHIVFISMIINRFSIQKHLIGLRVDFPVRFLLRLSVYLNSSLLCRLLNLRTASFIHFCKIFVKSNCISHYCHRHPG